MATVRLRGTTLSFLLLPPTDGYWARTELVVENEYISYREMGETLTVEEAEGLLIAISRLLAGGYAREYSLAFERASFAVDLYAHTQNGRGVSRELRREKDCVMALRLLMRSKDKKEFLDGVYTLLLHREELTLFVEELWKEYESYYSQRDYEGGEYTFVGVSPLGYRGCNYWYLDGTREVKKGGYVWVKMGRRKTEQIVYVDTVRRFDIANAPYDSAVVKQVLRKATKEEVHGAFLGKELPPRDD